MKKPSEPRNIIAESLRLIDKNGKMRVLLNTSEHGMPCFQMFDDNLRPLVSIGLGSPDEAHIALMRKTGEFLVGIQAYYDEQRVMLMLMDHSGKCVFKIDFDPIDFIRPS